MKTYIYIVNGSGMEDAEVWGDAWKWAKETAKAEHAGIKRATIKNGNIEHEFYAKGGCFVEYRDTEDFNRNVKIW